MELSMTLPTNARDFSTLRRPDIATGYVTLNNAQSRSVADWEPTLRESVKKRRASLNVDYGALSGQATALDGCPPKFVWNADNVDLLNSVCAKYGLHRSRRPSPDICKKAATDLGIPFHLGPVALREMLLRTLNAIDRHSTDRTPGTLTTHGHATIVNEVVRQIAATGLWDTLHSANKLAHPSFASGVDNNVTRPPSALRTQERLAEPIRFPRRLTTAAPSPASGAQNNVARPRSVLCVRNKFDELIRTSSRAPMSSSTFEHDTLAELVMLEHERGSAMREDVNDLSERIDAVEQGQQKHEEAIDVINASVASLSYEYGRASGKSNANNHDVPTASKNFKGKMSALRRDMGAFSARTDATEQGQQRLEEAMEIINFDLQGLEARTTATEEDQQKHEEVIETMHESIDDLASAQTTSKERTSALRRNVRDLVARTTAIEQGQTVLDGEQQQLRERQDQQYAEMTILGQHQQTQEQAIKIIDDVWRRKEQEYAVRLSTVEANVAILKDQPARNQGQTVDSVKDAIANIAADVNLSERQWSGLPRNGALHTQRGDQGEATDFVNKDLASLFAHVVTLRHQSRDHDDVLELINGDLAALFTNFATLQRESGNQDEAIDCINRDMEVLAANITTPQRRDEEIEVVRGDTLSQAVEINADTNEIHNLIRQQGRAYSEFIHVTQSDVASQATAIDAIRADMDEIRNLVVHQGRTRAEPIKGAEQAVASNTDLNDVRAMLVEQDRKHSEAIAYLRSDVNSQCVNIDTDLNNLRKSLAEEGQTRRAWIEVMQEDMDAHASEINTDVSDIRTTITEHSRDQAAAIENVRTYLTNQSMARDAEANGIRSTILKQNQAIEAAQGLIATWSATINDLRSSVKDIQEAQGAKTATTNADIDNMRTTVAAQTRAFENFVQEMADQTTITDTRINDVRALVVKQSQAVDVVQKALAKQTTTTHADLNDVRVTVAQHRADATRLTAYACDKEHPDSMLARIIQSEAQADVDAGTMDSLKKTMDALIARVARLEAKA